MLAFVNTTVTKSAILAQLHAHAKADQIVKGRYWRGDRGCAVGCTIHSGEHEEYEPRFGIPQMLAQLEDRIFEGLPNGASKQWPVRFMSAVQPGADLSCVGWQFLHWLLTNKEVNPGIEHPLVRDAIKQCADVLIPLTKGLPVNESVAWSAARSADSAACAAWSAESAARSAESAESAAWSAWSAESAASAASAAESAESAASAAWSAWSAARSADSAASAARSAESAAWSADSAASAAYVIMSDKLVALIEAAPIGGA